MAEGPPAQPEPTGRLATLRRYLDSGGRAWIARSRNRRIFATAAMIAALTAVGKIASVLKDISVAFRLGTHGSLDAFLAAFTLPGLAMGVIGGAVTAAFIPVYVETEHSEGKPAAHELLRGVMYWSIVSLCGVTVILAMFSGPLVRLLAPGFDANRLALAHRYFVLLLPTVILSGVASVLAAALNAGHRYAAAALAPMAVPLLTAGAIVAYGTRLDADSLCYGTTLGYLAQYLLLVVVARRVGLPVLPLRVPLTSGIRRVLRQFGPAAAGSIVMSGTTLVDQIMASFLGTGSVSTLNYANKVGNLVGGMVTLALGTAVLPHFSEMVTRQDWRGLRRTLQLYTRILAFTTVPLVVILIVLGRPIVSLLFHRGAFTAEDVTLVATTQSYYLLQVPFFAVGILIVRLISSLQRNDILFWGTIVSVVLNAVLDYVLMQRMGAPGIALATSCVYAVSWMYLRFSVSRVLPRDARG
jgi:putative peptidoglycan lipid II flippase